VAAKGKQITVYERMGPDVEAVADTFGKMLPMYSRQNLVDGMRAILDKNIHYSPMLHFTLVDPAARTFCAERVTYVVSLPDWVAIGGRGPLQELVIEVPKRWLARYGHLRGDVAFYFMIDDGDILELDSA
jgi:hypothetical protein